MTFLQTPSVDTQVSTITSVKNAVVLKSSHSKSQSQQNIFAFSFFKVTIIENYSAAVNFMCSFKQN